MNTFPGGDAVGPNLFAVPGEMAARCRAFDFAATSLGPVSAWSQSLRTIVSTMLASRHPMFLWWGPELVQIFNDGYLPSFGSSGRDVAALGARGREHWAAIWPVIGPQIEQVMKTGAATWHEDHLVPIERNGRVEDVYWTYGYSPVRDDDGTIAGTLVVVQETTARVRALAEREALLGAERAARAEAEASRGRADAAHESMARVFAQAPVAIAVLEGRELRYAVANPKYRQLIGDRDPVGKTLIEMFPELAGSEIQRVLVGVHDSAVPFAANDLLIRFDSMGTGEIDNYYDLAHHPLMSDEKHVEGIVVVAVDVTERRRTILERSRLLDEAEKARAGAELANRVKSEFLAMMSHELRTPLNAIGGHTQLLEMEVYGKVTVQQREALVRIDRAQRHLLSIVNDVLNLGRLQAESVTYNVQSVRLTDVVAQLDPLVIPQLRGKELVYAVDVAEECAVYADPEKLVQVLVNLVSNAVKFTPAGGEVRVRCGTRADGTGDLGMVYLRVCDTGVGIARQQLESIFDPFVQVDTTRAGRTAGTGLGLAISRDLARGMGGDLRARSTPGLGSTFTVTLPRAASSESQVMRV